MDVQNCFRSQTYVMKSRRSTTVNSRPLRRIYTLVFYGITIIAFILLFRCSHKYSPRCFNLSYVEENFLELDQKDEQLIQYSRIKYLSPPSPLPYKLQGPGNNSKHYEDAFSTWVANFFGNKTNGVFIEAGAHTGENPSHTLMLEVELNWNGLLAECNPTLVPSLRMLHRKAWVADVCLAPKVTPGRHTFFNNKHLWTQTGRLETKVNRPSKKDVPLFEVYSVPLYTLLAAIGWKEIDFFALDVEGAELEILQTFPFDLITIKVLTVEEYFHRVRGNVEYMDTLLKKNDLNFVGHIEQDRLYIHQSMMEQYNEMKWLHPKAEEYLISM